MFLSCIAFGVESHPGIGVESRYSEAVLAFNRKQNDDAMKILNSILEQHPDYTAALELKALTLRSEGKDRDAVDEYLKLIKIKPENERGPYYFEIGVICYRLKKMERAHEYLERSLTLHFNESAAHLFLGMIATEAGRSPEAEMHFSEVNRTGLAEMKVVAHYYLGLIYLKSGSPSRGTRELAIARELALSLPDSKMASDTLLGARKILEPFSKGQLFGTATFQLAYDSNISETPSDNGVQAQASNSSTVQSILNGGIGYMSPALEKIQWVPSYQFSYNKNFNGDTKSFEYLSNIVSVFLNYKALAETSFGVKLQGNYTFQNQPDDPANLNGSYTLSKYSLTGELGPYFYAQLAPHYRLQAELYIRPQEFYTQPDLSGTDYLLRTTVQQETASFYFNPGMSLALEQNSAATNQWKYRAFTLSAFDTLRLTARDVAMVGLDYTHYGYYVSQPSRADDTINPHMNLVHTLTDKWSLVGQMSYTTNTSSIPTSYSYNRFVFGAGISRAL